MLMNQVTWTALFVATLAVVSPSQDRPVTELPIVVSYVDVPTTLEHATGRANVVVRARVVGAQPRNRIRPSSKVPVVTTGYLLDVTEVLKSDPGLPLPSEVLREGGELLTPKGIQRYVEEGFPMFQIGEEYLFFLFWNEHLEAFQMAFGPDAAFRITPEERLQPLGRGALSRQYAGHDPRDVGSHVRKIVAATPKP